MNDSLAIQNAERFALETLQSYPQSSEFYCPLIQTTSPAVLVQEQPFTNSTQVFNFDFSMDAPEPSVTLNNVRLKSNNVFQIFGIALWQGSGANANTRSYATFGATNNEDCIYNSNVSISFETSKFVDLMPGRGFREVGDTNTVWDYRMGLRLINPLRILTGRLGVFTISIQCINPINTVPITANTFLSMRLFGILGQASSTSAR